MKDTFGFDDAVIPIFYPANMVRWLETEGYDRQAMIENTGLELEEIDAPEVLVTFGQHRTLICNALRLTNNPHLGLYFGQQLQLTAMGIAGYAAMSSDNLLQGLEIILKYIKLRAPLIKINMEKTPDNVHLVYEETLDYGPIRQFMYEASLTSASGMFSLMGAEDQPNTIAKIPIPEPEDWDKHKHLVKFPVQFDQENLEFIIPLEDLYKKSKLADPVSAKAAKKICDEQLKQIEGREGLISRIHSIIDDNADDFPSLVETADQLCVSARTLRRELQKLDTTYQTLLDEARKKQAIKLLKNSHFTIQEIAIKMGYTDPANFGRAFRKWTGQAPGYYRN